MTHEPDHTRTGTSKKEIQPPKGPFTADGTIPDAGSADGEFGAGGTGGHSDVVGGADGRGGEWFLEDSGDEVEEGTIYYFGFDGDFGCTRPPGLDGVWCPAGSVGDARDSAGDDCSFDAVPESEGERGRGRIAEKNAERGVQQGAEEGDSTWSFAEVFWKDRSKSDSETEDLFDPGDVSDPGEGIDPGT